MAIDNQKKHDESVGYDALLSKDSLMKHSERVFDGESLMELEVEAYRSFSDLSKNRAGTQLREKILSLPEEPGVYIYLDSSGNIIYVGKAKRLKRRVMSYFNRVHDSRKTNLLVRNICDLRYVVVATEEDALHLENAMIKEYKPRYNVLLKDDKSYPYIIVTGEPYPRVFMTHNPNEVKGRLFGPYSNVKAAKNLLNIIRELFPIRSCRHFIDENSIKAKKFRLCLDYHIKKCDGVCVGNISQQDYSAYVSQVCRILNGETSFVVHALRDEMAKLSEEWKFEEAQKLKEKYDLVEAYRAKSVIANSLVKEIDVFAYDENGENSYVSYMFLRHGAVVKSLILEYRHRASETKEELMSMAVGEIINRFGRRFNEVIVPFMPDMDFDSVSFVVPQRGEKKKLLDMGFRNAEQYRLEKEKMAEKLDPEQSVKRLMQRMKSDFRLNTEPRHIECFDNSNIQGTNPVASCVVFRNGRPSKRDYRHFNIKTVVGANDFASMKEILHRRYTRMMSEGESLPQLVVVDGGKGQLSAAVEAFDEMGLRGEVAIVGIAKRLEEIYFPGDSIPLYIDKKSESLRVIQALRDEAHRFGITHHRNRRSKGQIKSSLDEIKGIGPKTIQMLFREFKSVKRMKEASETDLASIVGNAKAKILFEALHSKK